MNREERKKRLNEILKERKQKEIIQEVYGDKIVFEILDLNNSNSIIEDFSVHFPFCSNRVDWGNTIVNRIEINNTEIKSIRSLLFSRGFDTSIPVYIFWGYDNHPCIKTNLTKELLNI